MNKGYTIVRSQGGDSDNLARYDILLPSGEPVMCELYHHELKSALAKLPDISDSDNFEICEKDVEYARKVEDALSVISEANSYFKTRAENTDTNHMFMKDATVDDIRRMIPVQNIINYFYSKTNHLIDNKLEISEHSKQMYELYLVLKSDL